MRKEYTLQEYQLLKGVQTLGEKADEEWVHPPGGPVDEEGVHTPGGPAAEERGINYIWDPGDQGQNRDPGSPDQDRKDKGSLEKSVGPRVPGNWEDQREGQLLLSQRRRKMHPQRTGLGKSSLRIARPLDCHTNNTDRLIFLIQNFNVENKKS